MLLQPDQLPFMVATPSCHQTEHRQVFNNQAFVLCSYIQLDASVFESNLSLSLGNYTSSRSLTILLPGSLNKSAVRFWLDRWTVGLCDGIFALEEAHGIRFVRDECPFPGHSIPAPPSGLQGPTSASVRSGSPGILVVSTELQVIPHLPFRL